MPDREIRNATIIAPDQGENSGLELRLGEFVGAGAQAAIYRGHLQGSSDTVAVKIYDPFTGEGAREQRAGFDQEGKLVNWNHENIVRVHWHGVGRVAVQNTVTYDRPLTIMEYAPEGSLRDLLKKREAGQIQMSSLEAAKILGQLAQGTAYAHARNLMHGDIKPANVLMKNGRPKLTDFGIASRLRHAHSNVPTPALIRGSIAYMAPEALAGKNVEQTDIYALGVLGYQLLTGRLPFEQASLDKLVDAHRHRKPPRFNQLEGVRSDAVLLNFEEIIRKALRKKPSKRFTSMADFNTEVNTTLAQLIAEAPTITRLGRTSTRRGSRSAPPSPTLPYTRQVEPPQPAKRPAPSTVKPRKPEPDVKVVSRPKGATPGRPKPPRGPSGPGGLPPKTSPKPPNGPGDNKRETPGTNQESSRRSALKILGGVGVGIIIAGGIAEGLAVEKGVFLEAQPYATDQLRFTPESSRHMAHIGDRLMALGFEITSDNWVFNRLMKAQAPVNPDANVFAAQQLLRLDRPAQAAYAAAITAPYHPDKAEKILEMILPLYKKGEELPQSILLAAASLAPVKPDEMRALIREFDASLLQKQILDAAIDPSTGDLEGKIRRQLVKISGDDDKEYYTTMIAELITPRMASSNPDALIAYIESLPNKSFDDRAYRVELTKTLVPYRPQYAVELLEELGKHNSKEYQTAYGSLAVKFAPFHPSIAKSALDHLRKVGSTNGAISNLPIALCSKYPNTLRAQYEGDKEHEYWGAAEALALNPGNKKALAKVEQYIRKSPLGPGTLVALNDALMVSHTQRVKA